MSILLAVISAARLNQPNITFLLRRTGRSCRDFLPQVRRRDISWFNRQVAFNSGLAWSQQIARPRMQHIGDRIESLLIR